MSILGRVLGSRRKDAIELWLAQSSASTGQPRARWTAEPEFEHAPDLGPEDVPPPQRVGFDGRPLHAPRGPITGLEGGGHGPRGHHTGP